MPKVLIVDDDIDLSSTIEMLLQADAWSTEKTHTGADALQLLKSFKFDVIILDWNLPDMTGISICREFRESGGETPIIFLTGRNTYPDKELGFGSGADDYLTKPFDNRELLLRARALLRRPAHLAPETPIINGVSLDRKSKRVFVGNANAQLSSTEFAIIEFLFLNAGTFYSASQLFEALWPTETESTSEVVRVHVRVLRRKLELLGVEDLIQHVRGAGYVVEQEGWFA